MILEFNETLVNVHNICSCKRYYQITKTPGLPEKKDYFRMDVMFIGVDKSIMIEFKSAEQMDEAYNKLRQY